MWRNESDAAYRSSRFQNTAVSQGLPSGISA
jgi:hypothetical protein